MEAFREFRFRSGEAAAGADVLPADFAGNEETDDADSFFDLVLKSPDSVAAEKVFRFVESPRDVFARRSDFASSKPLYKVTLVRSTPKLRVFMLGFRKSPKFEKSECNGEARWSPVKQLPRSSEIEERKRLSVKCRVEKASVACRVAGDNSLRSQLLRETFDRENSPEKSSRGSLPKYLKLIRPLYLMVWKRQHEKTKVTESSTPSETAKLSPRRISDGSRIGSFKIAARRLGKSRSVSTAVGRASEPARRRDDSLLERHDGIQNAVLYCKRSYNSSSKGSNSAKISTHNKFLHLNKHVFAVTINLQYNFVQFLIQFCSYSNMLIYIIPNLHSEISKLFPSSAGPSLRGRYSYEEPKRSSI